MPTISVCIIVKNEEKMLPACLSSVKNIADEIIVVDTGSTDKSVEISLQHHCKVIRMQWNNNFAEARNKALSAASGDWILSIDADERLLTQSELRRAINAVSQKVGGLLIAVESSVVRTDGSTDFFASSLLRLFRRHPKIFWQNIIHEQVIESVYSAGYTLQTTNIRFSHLGYNLPASEMLAKHIRNLDLLNSAIADNQRDGYMLFHRAKIYRAIGKYAEAEQDIAAALETVQKYQLVRPQALNEGAILAFQQQQYDLAIRRAVESLGIIPNQLYPYFILGETFSALLQFDPALQNYLLLKNTVSDSASLLAGEHRLPQEQLEFRIGRSYVGLGDYISAELHFNAGIILNPNEIGCIVGLANISARNREWSTSLSLLDKALNISPSQTEIQDFRRRIQEQISVQTAVESREVDDVPFVAEKPLLSLTMIVKNEENMLSDCLESVRGIVDEIVVVDTGSDDSTKEIAAQYGANVHSFPWTGDFSEARNVALSHASGEWILYMDADERLHEQAATHLRGLLKSMPEEVGALLCTIVSPHRQESGVSEVHTGAYPRVFRNYGYPSINFSGRVHEQISPSILALKKNIVRSEIVIRHLGYDLERAEMEQKVQRNCRLLLDHVREEPNNAYAWFQLGQTLARMSLVDGAIDALKLSMELGGLAVHIESSCAAVLAQLYGNKKDFTQALNWADSSLKLVPDQIYALHLKAFALAHLGYADEAVSCFEETRNRLHNRNAIEQNTGFEVEIPERLIDDGILLAKSKSASADLAKDNLHRPQIDAPEKLPFGLR